MTAPDRTTYRTAIVGAGILGLYTAYHLARAGAGPILVVDRGFLSSGASGRNGGGVRQQWETSATVKLARESVEAYRRFGTEFGYNIWFRQSGYLFLAETPEELARLRKVHDVVRGEGLPSEVLEPGEVAERVEGLDTRTLVGATYLRSDGVLYPFPALWGLYEAVRASGVEVRLGTEAVGASVKAGRVRGLVLAGGTVAVDSLVNAAGGWSAEFAARAGLSVPNSASRHEICATEPLKPFLDPMVVRSSDGLYFSQTMRGEIVGGLTMAHPRGTAGGVPSSTEFLGRYARALLGLVPRLRTLGVLRAWAGFYDDTPDGLPVIGRDPRLGGYVHASGFGGHGFMLAPAAGRRVAQVVLGEPTERDLAALGIERFLGADRPVAAEGLTLG